VAPHKDILIGQTSFDQCLDRKEDLAAIQQDLTAARGKGVTATPYFLINGQPLVAGSVDQFSRAIDAELAKAGR